MRLFGLMLFFLVVGCRKVPYSYHPDRRTENASENAGLAFIVFRIKTDSTDHNSITLISINRVEGKLKREAPPSGMLTPSVRVAQLDGSFAVLQSVTIPHPLYKSVEFADSEHGFARKMTALKETDFFVRLEMLPETTHISIEEIFDDRKGEGARFKIN